MLPLVRSRKDASLSRQLYLFPTHPLKELDNRPCWLGTYTEPVVYPIHVPFDTLLFRQNGLFPKDLC